MGLVMIPATVSGACHMRRRPRLASHGRIHRYVWGYKDAGSLFRPELPRTRKRHERAWRRRPRILQRDWMLTRTGMMEEKKQILHFVQDDFSGVLRGLTVERRSAMRWRGYGRGRRGLIYLPLHTPHPALFPIYVNRQERKIIITKARVAGLEEGELWQI